MSFNHYLDAQATLFNICKGLKTELASVSPNLTVFKFDAAEDETSLPETDLLGPFKFTVSNESGLLVIMTQIVVSTLNDKNLFRLDDIINAVFNKFAPEKRLPLLNAQTGQTIGMLVTSDETTVLPIERASSRPIKSVAVELRSDRAMPRA